MKKWMLFGLSLIAVSAMLTLSACGGQQESTEGGAPATTTEGGETAAPAPAGESTAPPAAPAGEGGAATGGGQ